jgi:hypothetical protein
MPLKPTATPKQAKEPVLTAQILLIGQFHIKIVLAPYSLHRIFNLVV